MTNKKYGQTNNESEKSVGIRSSVEGNAIQVRRWRSGRIVSACAWFAIEKRRDDQPFTFGLSCFFVSFIPHRRF
jgi:hypothetical protein